MNFRTSYLVGLIATTIVAIAAPSIHSATAAEPLKITGPDGQVKSQKQLGTQVNQGDPQAVRQYGPTTSSDTFWSIAQAVKPDNSVTVYQVMSALFDANPHAFSSKNYNSLERGMILLVPSKAVMLQTPAAEAKARAERNDQSWSSAVTVAKPSVVSKPSQPSNTSPKPKPNPLIAELSEEVKTLTAQLESIQAKNLELTDELARASDEIVVGSSDTAAFQDEISQLKQENALLKQALQEAKTETESLEQELKVSQQQVSAAKEVSQPTSDLWRTIMDNPLLLVLAAVLPAIIVIGLFWLFLRRKNQSSENQTSAEQPALGPEDKPDSNATEKVDDAEDMAVHLDTDGATDDLPLKEVTTAAAVGAAAAAATLADEQDIVVEDSQDEGQSLDDLWAEAMGEQDQADSLTSLKTETGDSEDLDALFAGFDEVEPQSEPQTEIHAEVEQVATNAEADSTSDDDLDALLAGFDEVEAEEVATNAEADSTADDDIDALLAGFDEVEAEEVATNAEADNAADDDIDALLAGFDEVEAEEVATNAEAGSTADDDIDALLAGFDEVEAEEVATNAEADSNADDDIDALLAGFDEVEAEEVATIAEADNTADDDIDALLAGFDEVEAEQVAINDDAVAAPDDELEALLASLDNDKSEDDAEKDIDTLSDEMAEELALGVEIAAELEDEDNAQEDKLDSELDSEIDALLAEFDMSTEAVAHEETELEQQADDKNPLDPESSLVDENLVDENLADVLEFSHQDYSENKPRNDGLVDLDIESSDVEPVIASDEGESSVIDTDEHEVVAEFKQQPESISAADEQDFLTRELQNAAAEQAQLDSAQQAELDAFLSPQGSVEADSEATVADKDSGFFDDLKSDKPLTDNSLDWESISDSNDLSDEELLNRLAATAQAEDNALDLSDDAFTLDSDSKMTVDEALAALDAEEYVEHKQTDVASEQQDLSNFERDNGFIDIDMLLSEADEDNGEVDLYKQFDVDMGELNSLMGNSSMVDVDDEENSVNAKLDLARAYIEIDDNDSARALLQEVELDGNERQQAEAIGLLKDLV
ncbi:FimV/HubP family polar landmark protein [Shewanella fidelis]|uniref:Pilus assembly protein FimV n=1 Tax=Shewanella fidelis TaxID=173509 RepID=A0AAW8NL08_9GAMM|nr:FimV/HubP family polar landmark protein [Shewanella fidelis]MDR8523366.1 pilus assembly protein FimV [Shewanella fidelis]MDW4813400.1 pilus assembly protein FimV [Shewanella fidelis]MDW4817228.1 pilus assembly protein FimV [Shewanella fidelis]MDW4821415.1 pilus assembly protein FimV [Shewanella fidelis]MDW4824507.1 pilus assembly protein FimV [Shewanella fidelis]